MGTFSCERWFLFAPLRECGTWVNLFLDVMGHRWRKCFFEGHFQWSLRDAGLGCRKNDVLLQIVGDAYNGSASLQHSSGHVNQSLLRLLLFCFPFPGGPLLSCLRARISASPRCPSQLWKLPVTTGVGSPQAAWQSVVKEASRKQFSHRFSRSHPKDFFTNSFG